MAKRKNGKRGGLSAKRKGSRNERLAVKELSRYLTTLYARRVPGSGAFSHRFDGGEEPQFMGDIQIRTQRHVTVEYIEVKCRNPMSKPITIADMDRWRKGRRILMARHDRGSWLCSMWATVWDDLCPAWEQWIEVIDRPTRGVELQDICPVAGGGMHWGAAIYMDAGTLADILEAKYGEPEAMQTEVTP